MAAILDTLRPGDVISSDLLNRIITMLNQHDSLIASGGGGSSTNLISGFNPPAEQNVGNTLIVFGGFDFPLSSNTVSIDGIPIAPAAFLLGSGATQIVFSIPASIVIPPAGSKAVIVRVVNSQGTGERTYSLKPQVAGPPAPTISALANHATNTLPLLSSANARITGQNFATSAASNRVRLIFNPGTPGQTAFPPNPGDSLVIDVAASSINAAPANSTLVVMMPAIGAALIPLIGQQAGAAIELTAPGAGSVSLGAQIRRTA